MMISALVSAASVLLAGQATPQVPPVSAPPATPPEASGSQDPGSTDLGTIEVVGETPAEDLATAFVQEVAVAPRGRGLARWDTAVCVGVANMNARFAQFMIDRVSLAAVGVGLDIGEPGCRPNIIIAAAADADDLATALVRDDPTGYRPSSSNTDLGSVALANFQSSDSPVRWWHVSLPVSVDTGDIAVRLSGEEAPTIAVRDASRLRANVRDDLARVVIILDTTQIAGVPYAALSDYVALIALAQIDATAETGSWPSVLNLFAGDETSVTGLTDWDRSYLTSLYAASRDRARASQQEREIVDGIVNPETETEQP